MCNNLFKKKNKNTAFSRFLHIIKSYFNEFELFYTIEIGVCLVGLVIACGMLSVWFLMGTTYL